MRGLQKKRAPRHAATRSRALVAAVFAIGLAAVASAADAPEPAFPPPIAPAVVTRLGPDSGLPVPRFASLKFDEVNGREGPSFEHPVLWRYQRRGLPVEVIEEDLGWRKIRDPDGAEVWMHERVLENRRTGLVEGAPIKILRRPDDDAPVAAVAEPGVLFEIKACRDGFMRVDGPRATGWVHEGALWGAGCG
jgi:SH3-like domain-containing protein